MVITHPIARSTVDDRRYLVGAGVVVSALAYAEPPDGAPHRQLRRAALIRAARRRR